MNGTRSQRTPPKRILSGRVLSGLSKAFLACLLLCVASGLVLAFHYRPLGDVARCVEEITALAPFGFFFRRLHYWSGQACVLLALGHVLHYLAAGAAGRVAAGRWARLVCGLAVCLALLLTGFMLKGDLEALSAATVLSGLAGSLPLVGRAASGLLVGRGGEILFPPYVLHCLVLPPALFLLVRGHVRRWSPGWRGLAVVGLAVSAWCLIVPLPLPAGPGAGDVSGPWFLLGLQEMLRHGPPLLAGVAAPALGLALLAALPLLRGGAAAAGRYAVLAGAALYAVLTLGLVLG